MTDTYKTCKFRFISLAAALMIVISASCRLLGKNDVSQSPPGYNLNSPIVIKLPLELDEISGVSFHDTDKSVFAINDERGWLYKIYPTNINKIEKWKFADGGDFEDVVLLDSIFYVLKSNGNIISFKFLSTDSLMLDEYSFPEKHGNEFETLYYDDQRRKIILICKDCDADKKKYLSTFTFDPWSMQYSDSSFAVNVKPIAEMLNEKSVKFKPSAAAIHPLTGELYILSSVNKLLVVADRDGNPKNVYKLSSDFKQPEGICFTRTGNMIISNEAAGIGVANIMVYFYNPVKR